MWRKDGRCAARSREPRRRWTILQYEWAAGLHVVSGSECNLWVEILHDLGLAALHTFVTEKWNKMCKKQAFYFVLFYFPFLAACIYSESFVSRTQHKICIWWVGLRSWWPPVTRQEETLPCAGHFVPEQLHRGPVHTWIHLLSEQSRLFFHFFSESLSSKQLVLLSRGVKDENHTAAKASA